MLRDKFAMAALQGILSDTETWKSMAKTSGQMDIPFNDVVAKTAYELSDAMMKERAKQDFSGDPENVTVTGTLESDTPIRRRELHGYQPKRSPPHKP